MTMKAELANEKAKRVNRDHQIEHLENELARMKDPDDRPLLNQVADMVEAFKEQKGEFIADRIRIRYGLGKYRKY